MDSFPELQCLLDSLPPKALCDHLVDVYTKNFEKVFRILHVPSFLRQYSELWEKTSEISFTKDFVPLLMAVLAVSIVVLGSPSSNEHTSSWYYLKQNAHDHVLAWLKKLPRKQRTEFTTLQVATLLLLSRQLRLVEGEELWKASGELVRSAMVMGLHVNTSTSTRLTPFQKECRRRLWITISEMDLQVSICSGMPIMAPEVDFKSLTPANLNDSDFDENTLDILPVRDSNEETDSLFQICLAASLSQRIKIMKMAQHTSPQDSLEECWEQMRKLEAFLDNVPIGLKPSNELGDIQSFSYVLNRVILDVFLRRPLLTLLQPLIASGTHYEHPSSPETQKAYIKLALSVLSYQDYFDPEITGLDLFNAPDASWEIFLAFFHHDILGAALGVCAYMRNLTQMSSQQISTNHRYPLITSSGQPISKASLIRLVENTLDTLTRRISERGTNVKDVLLLAVVLQSARGRGTTTQNDQIMSQGARKALLACRQHLLSKQSDESILFSTPGTVQMV